MEKDLRLASALYSSPFFQSNQNFTGSVFERNFPLGPRFPFSKCQFFYILSSIACNREMIFEKSPTWKRKLLRIFSRVDRETIFFHILIKLAKFVTSNRCIIIGCQTAPPVIFAKNSMLET